jgi:transposase
MLLKQAQGRQITQKQAAQRMQVSERWVRKMLQRMKVVGDSLVIHGLRGKPSNRRLPDEFRHNTLSLIRSAYPDHSPKLVWAYLAEKHGIQIGKETLRQWMIQDGLWAPTRRRGIEVSSWGPRREKRGEYVHWYACHADWLGNGNGGQYLIAFVGDATSTVVARFAPVDAAEDHISVLQEYLKKWGRPQEFRFGKAVVQGDPPEIVLAADSVKPPPSILRILERLDISWSLVEPPSPSGRVQHFYAAAWNRLIERFRKNRVTSTESANRYLSQVYLPSWNSRMTVEPSSGIDAHRPMAKRQIPSLVG